MLGALAGLGAEGWVGLGAKAALYLASLLAAGSVLFLAVFPSAGAQSRRAARRILALGAAAAVLLSLARLGLQASFLGGTPAAAFDPVLLRIVVESPFGTSLLLRVAGAALCLAALGDRGADRGAGHGAGRRAGRGAWLGAGLFGALIVCGSFAFVGHTLAPPRALAGGFVTLHLLGLAFWLGALGPLVAATRGGAAQGAALAERFGRIALGVVALLALAGALLFALLTGGRVPDPARVYDQAMTTKLALVLGVLALAGLNRMRLTPALRAGRAGAGAALRRSIAAEAGLILGVLALTAAMTGLAAPR
ncbi:MAG: CopD family protein [Pseudomonadota bacterium]